MRWLILLTGLTAAALQAGCGASPQSLGITGPGPRVAPNFSPDDATIQNPGIPDANTSSDPEQRFFRYN